MNHPLGVRCHPESPDVFPAFDLESSAQTKAKSRLLLLSNGTDGFNKWRFRVKCGEQAFRVYTRTNIPMNRSHFLVAIDVGIVRETKVEIVHADLTPVFGRIQIAASYL